MYLLQRDQFFVLLNKESYDEFCIVLHTNFHVSYKKLNKTLIYLLQFMGLIVL